MSRLFFCAIALPAACVITLQPQGQRLCPVKVGVLRRQRLVKAGNRLQHAQSLAQRITQVESGVGKVGAQF
jgi:hypothetical protein